MSTERSSLRSSRPAGSERALGVRVMISTLREEHEGKTEGRAEGRYRSAMEDHGST